MAATQQQRAALYTRLADTMGEEAADTLMGELPPAGWEQMATKDNLAALESRFTAALTEGLSGLGNKLTEGLAAAAEERAALSVKLTEGLAELGNKLTEGLAAAAEERAQLFRSQARQLYVIVSTIVAAAVSIWIALYNMAG